MHITTRKEQFSLAFIHAVASVAGFGTVIIRVDDDSIDIGVRAKSSFGTKKKAPQLDIQAKCTETDTRKGKSLSFPLKLKNYNDLRERDLHIPRILVVVCVPKDVTSWLNESPKQTAMRRCAYWRSLHGEPDISNDANRSIAIPRSQMFTVESLTSIMQRIGDGDSP